MGWYINGYEFKYRRKITITNNTSETLYDFPVCIILDSSNFDFTHFENNGNDVRFTTTGGTLLRYYIELIDIDVEKAKIWVKVPKIPANSSVDIYMYYGCSEAPDTSDPSVFDIFDHFTSLETSRYTQKADHPSPRSDAVAFSIGKYGYIGLGYNESGRLSDFWRYDPETDTWEKIADFPGGGRTGAVAFAIGEYGYVGLGFDGNQYCNDFWRYDPKTDTWTQVADFPGNPRATAVAFVIGNKAYVGLGDIRQPTDEYYVDFYCYDPETNTWTRIADFPDDGRENALAFAVNGKGYVGCGQKPDHSDQKDFWEYDPETNTWTQITTDFGGANREAGVGWSIGSYGYFGFGNSDELGNVCVKDVWRFDPITKTFEQLEDFPSTERSKPSVFVIGNKAYICCGNNIDTILGDVYEFKESWEQSQGTWSQSNSEVTTSDNPGCLSRAYSRINLKVIIKGRQGTENACDFGCFILSDAKSRGVGGNFYWFKKAGGGAVFVSLYQNDTYVSSVVSGTAISDTNPHIIAVSRYNGNFKIWHDDELLGSGTDNTLNTSKYFVLVGSKGGTCTIPPYFDYVIVVPYIDPEPSITIGSEEGIATEVVVTNEDAYHGNYSCKFTVVAQETEGEKCIGIKQSQDLTGFNKIKFALKITELTGSCAFEVWSDNTKLAEYTTTQDWNEKEVDVSTIDGTHEIKFIARAKDVAEYRKIVAYLDYVRKSV